MLHNEQDISSISSTNTLWQQNGNQWCMNYCSLGHGKDIKDHFKKKEYQININMQKKKWILNQGGRIFFFFGRSIFNLIQKIIQIISLLDETALYV